MINEANQDPLYRDLNEIYQEREKLFQQRERDYLEQKNTLNNLLESIKQEKETLNKKEQELKKQQEELHKEEQNQQTWYQQLCEERKQLERDKEELNKKEKELETAKDSMEVRYQVQIEKAKNMEIQAKQSKETFEHKLDMLGLVLDADGKPGGEATKFFESLLGGMNKENEEELQSLEEEKKAYENESKFLKEELKELDKKNKQIEEENNQLQSEKEQLSEEIKRIEAEKNRLLTLVSSISQSKEEEAIPNFGTNEEEEEDVPNFGTNEEEDVPNFGTKEKPYVPTFGRKQESNESERKSAVFEELTASVLNRYLVKNEPKYISSEIKHSEEGEQLHVNINNLDYVFLFSSPAAFDISVPKKKSRALDKLLVRLNTQHPGVKFYYDEQEHRVYASGYFSNTMAPDCLMEKVHEVSDCFRQK